MQLPNSLYLSISICKELIFLQILTLLFIVRSVPDEVNVDVDVLVKEEPRVEGEELMENDYHQLDPLVLRAETELWCDCSPVGMITKNIFVLKFGCQFGGILSPF